MAGHATRRERFADRRDAGRRLAAALAQVPLDRPLVLALPRGGVPVGFEVANALGARLEVFVARKIGAPGHPEYGIGAIAEGGEPVIDEWAVRSLRIGSEQLARLAATERRELGRRVALYRAERPLPDPPGDVVLVDDGLATGVTAEAALRALRPRVRGRLVLAVPVCAPESAARLAPLADLMVCLLQPGELQAVGRWYRDFDQTTDREVLDLLIECHEHPVTLQAGERG